MVKKWQEYYSQLQKAMALGHCAKTETIEYGDLIYQSPEILQTRWLVMDFKGEYNVFFDKTIREGQFERNFGATFTWREKALEFALEMFLVCSGNLRRKNRYNWITEGHHG